ncbi:MAG: serine hydrolase [Bacillota bacterium]|nr:serine hydrolase [Bacillota bacterium]
MFENIINQVTEKELKVYGIEVFHNGEVIFRHSFLPDVRYPIYSATKAFTATAVGIASDEGRLSVDMPLYHFLEQKYLQFIPAPQMESFKKLTFQRFLTMSVPGYPFRPQGNDWLEYALSLPMNYNQPPAFDYSNIPAYLVGAACENAVGQHLMKYLTPRLFEPLGMEVPTYQNCPQGHFYGASGMELTVHELSKLGQLYLQKGLFDGKRILSGQWVKKAVSKQIMNREGGYGYFFWILDDGFRISGKWGQKCLVYPYKNLMITYLSDLPDNADMMMTIAGQIKECFP